MPRKSSYTREQVASKALRMIRTRGIDSLTARSLGAAMGCSSSPIFTLYSGMDEVLGEVRKLANNIFADYMDGVLEYDRPFHELSLRLMRFARKETNLFYFLFLQKEPAVVKDIQPDVYQSLQVMGRDCGLSDDQMKALSEQMWAFTCGLAILVNRQADIYPEELVSDMLTRQFYATTDFIKSGKSVKVDAPKLRVQ